jgi:sugar phosphate isomerase/epimerase
MKLGLLTSSMPERSLEDIAAWAGACIDAAAALGGVHVGTFIGRDPGRSVAENLREAERVFPPLVEYADERGVRLMIDNCVMEGWHPDGYPATSPTRPSCGSGCSGSGST